MKTIAVASALFGCFVCMTPTTYAQDEGPHDGSIKARQAMFQLYGFSLGTLSAMAKEKREYDAELATEAAKNLELASSLGQSAFWPQGSDDSDSANRENRALPDIWENLSDVQDKFGAMQEAIAALQPVAGAGLDGLKGAVNDVGRSCKSCHDDYRAERE